MNTKQAIALLDAHLNTCSMKDSKKEHALLVHMLANATGKAARAALTDLLTNDFLSGVGSFYFINNMISNVYSAQVLISLAKTLEKTLEAAPAEVTTPAEVAPRDPDLAIRLERRTLAVNKVNNYLNTTAPKIAARLAQGYKLKADGVTFYNVDNRELTEIIKACPAFRASFKVSGDVIQVATSETWHAGGCSWFYVDDWINVWDVKKNAPLAFTKLPIYSDAEIARLPEHVELIKVREAQIEELQRSIVHLKQLTGGLS